MSRLYLTEKGIRPESSPKYFIDWLKKLNNFRSLSKEEQEERLRKIREDYIKNHPEKYKI